jgi:hypothetical protein
MKRNNKKKPAEAELEKQKDLERQKLMGIPEGLLTEDGFMCPGCVAHEHSPEELQTLPDTAVENIKDTLFEKYMANDGNYGTAHKNGEECSLMAFVLNEADFLKFDGLQLTLQAIHLAIEAKNNGEECQPGHTQAIHQ